MICRFKAAAVNPTISENTKLNCERNANIFGKIFLKMIDILSFPA